MIRYPKIPLTSAAFRITGKKEGGGDMWDPSAIVSTSNPPSLDVDVAIWRTH